MEKNKRRKNGEKTVAARLQFINFIDSKENVKLCSQKKKKNFNEKEKAITERRMYLLK